MPAFLILILFFLNIGGALAKVQIANEALGIKAYIYELKIGQTEKMLLRKNGSPIKN